MIRQPEFKKALFEALPNFKTDKAFTVLVTNATVDYALIRAQELIGEAMTDPKVFHDRLIRAIQLLTIARIKDPRKDGNEPTPV